MKIELMALVLMTEKEEDKWTISLGIGSGLERATLEVDGDLARRIGKLLAPESAIKVTIESQ